MPRLLVVGALIALAACGMGQAASREISPATVPDIGALPEVLSESTEPSVPAPTTTASVTVTPTSSESSAPGTEPVFASYEGPIGRAIDGNRVLVIGDSIFEAISDGFGGQLCDRLVPRGWAVEVQAETGQHVDFGLRVLDERLAAGWDAAAVMLGNNYRNDPAEFAAGLEQIVQRLAPRPTLLFTVTEFEDAQVEVNFVLRSVAARHDHVRLVEWAHATRDSDELLGDDGLHLSELGRAALADLLASELSIVDGIGACLSGEPVETID